MTDTIKMVLIVLGFIILLAINMAFKQVFWPIVAISFFAFIGFAKAIWKYDPKKNDNDKLDKTL